MLENTRLNPARRVKIPTSSFSTAREGGFEGLEDPYLELFPRLEKEAFRGFFSFLAFTCFTCHSLHLQIFMNNICVQFQMQTLLMAVSYARELG